MPISSDEVVDSTTLENILALVRISLQIIKERRERDEEPKEVEKQK
jgi:hypothetical protein